MAPYSIKKRYSTLFFRAVLSVSSTLKRSPSLACGIKIRGTIRAATAVKTKAKAVGSFGKSRFILMSAYEIRAKRATSET